MDSPSLQAPTAVCFCALLSACGGEGGCIDMVPNPTVDFRSYDGLDTADMNADGLNDIVVAGALIYMSDPKAQECGAVADSDSSITVLLQDISEPGTFLAPQRYPLFTSGGSALKLADLNLDSRPDVIVTGRWSSKTFEILLHNGEYPGQLQPTEAYTTVSEPHQIGVGDIDLDGLPDIAIAGETTVSWHRQSSNTDFSTRNDIGIGHSSVALIDFDKDGLLDVATHDSGPDSNILIYKQSPGLPGVFSLWQSIGTDLSLWTIGAGDLNNDDQPDIAAAGFYATSSLKFHDVWYRVSQTSQNPLSFDVQQPKLWASNSLNMSPLITDLDGDQKEDVVIVGDNVAVFLQGDVDGDFSAKQVYTLPDNEVGSSSGVVAVAVADLNGDLLPDLAVSNGEVLILFQQPGAPGTFGPAVRIAGWQP